MAKKINYTDSLRVGTDKLNASIEDASQAKSKAENAEYTASEAKSEAQEAKTQVQNTQDQLNQTVIEGDSSVEAAQARVGIYGEEYTVLKDREDAAQNTLQGVVSLKPFPKGVVSFVYDDGLDNHYTSAFDSHTTKGVPMMCALDIGNVLNAKSGRLTFQQMQEMNDSGLVEFASHSYSHARLDSAATLENVINELSQGQELIKKIGLNPLSYVGPYSTFYEAGGRREILEKYHSCGFTKYADGTNTDAEIVNSGSFDIYRLKRINVTVGLTRLQQLIDYAAANNAWLVIYAHDVGTSGEITKTDLETLLDYALAANVDLYNPNDVISILSTRNLAKERVDVTRRDAISLAGQSPMNHLNNSKLEGDTFPAGWKSTTNLTSSYSTSINESFPGNEFVLTTDGTNTGAGEVFALLQDVQCSSVKDFEMLNLSLRAKCTGGSGNIRVRLTFKDSTGAQLSAYDALKEETLDTIYKTFSVSTTIPKDDAIDKITVAIYGVVNDANSAVDFYLAKPQLNTGSKPSAYIATAFKGTDAFHADKNSSQTGLTSGGYTKVTYERERVDEMGTYNHLTSTYTPQAPGVYYLAASIEFSASVDASRLILAIYKNGSVYVTQTEASSGTGQQGVNVSCVVPANGSTDYFEVFAYQNTGSDQTISAQPYSTFHGFKIG